MGSIEARLKRLERTATAGAEGPPSAGERKPGQWRRVHEHLAAGGAASDLPVDLWPLAELYVKYVSVIEAIVNRQTTARDESHI